MRYYGIDLMTKDKPVVTAALRTICINVVSAHRYTENNHYSCLFVRTDGTEEELERFLYHNNLPYLGVFTLSGQ